VKVVPREKDEVVFDGAWPALQEASGRRFGGVSRIVPRLCAPDASFFLFSGR
jgi:hypothetical protein